MFKSHPKGLVGAAMSNMGERFGFYIMMAILSLFLISKYGLEKTQATVIYSVFYALTYLLALAGGLIADRTKKYKATIMWGLVCMSVGYLMIAYPTPTPVPDKGLYLGVTCVGLFVIALGNGLFKGNLQAVIGQLYDNPAYAGKRDTGYQLFYMFINIGALFAPLIAVGIRNGWVAHEGFAYNPDLPGLCHQYLGGTLSESARERFGELAVEVSGGGVVGDLGAFACQYLEVFNRGFHYAFGAAIGAMLVSIVIFLLNRRRLPDPGEKVVSKAEGSEGVAVEGVSVEDAVEVRRRLYGLFSVFAVVIFFWFSFHQNGVTLTFFANDYTNLSMFDFDLGFTTIKGAEIFQFFNPFFVVLLTPLVIGLFGWLKARGQEPSTPKKIALGMGVASLAYVVMVLGSVGLPEAAEVKSLGGLSDTERVTPYLLIGTYFILTVAELFISPLGLSFVSKVAPRQYQGIMQGCWLGATALGNQLLIFGAIFYEELPLWGTWLVFVGACLVSMLVMLGLVKWLERITS